MTGMQQKLKRLGYSDDEIDAFKNNELVVIYGRVKDAAKVVLVDYDRDRGLEASMERLRDVLKAIEG